MKHASWCTADGRTPSERAAKTELKIDSDYSFWHLVWLASWYDKYLPKQGGGKVNGFVPKGTLQRLDFYAITNSRHDPVSMPT